jgi:uncharacterized membrane protein
LPTLALILLPTLFLALRSPVALVAVPGLLLRFVSTDPAYWGTYWHYNATVMTIVFIAAIDGIARIRANHAARPEPAEPWPRRHVRALSVYLERHGPAMMLATCVALAFQFPLSSLWNPQSYQLGPNVAAARAAMALVPDGATVETDLALLAPLASRTDTFWLGTAGNPATQYVVFDAVSSDYQPPPANVLSFVEGVNHGVRYDQIYQLDGVYVFRRSAFQPG